MYPASMAGPARRRRVACGRPPLPHRSALRTELGNRWIGQRHGTCCSRLVGAAACSRELISPVLTAPVSAASSSAPGDAGGGFDGTGRDGSGRGRTAANKARTALTCAVRTGLESAFQAASLAATAFLLTCVQFSTCQCSLRRLLAPRVISVPS